MGKEPTQQELRAVAIFLLTDKSHPRYVHEMNGVWFDVFDKFTPPHLRRYPANNAEIIKNSADATARRIAALACLRHAESNAELWAELETLVNHELDRRASPQGGGSGWRLRGKNETAEQYSVRLQQRSGFFDEQQRQAALPPPCVRFAPPAEATCAIPAREAARRWWHRLMFWRQSS